MHTKIKFRGQVSSNKTDKQMRLGVGLLIRRIRWIVTEIQPSAVILRNSEAKASVLGASNKLVE